ncbi:MAG: GNAT family N-acetyltransferase [Bdellovibrionota bacterium]
MSWRGLCFKDYAGKGYGTKLLKKIEDVAREKSASQLRVTISKNSEGFFTKNGYEILGPNLRQTIGGQVLEFLPLFKEMVSEEISDED